MKDLTTNEIARYFFKFLEVKIAKHPTVNASMYVTEDYPLFNQRLTCLTTHFHDDWNWLMLVAKNMPEVNGVTFFEAYPPTGNIEDTYKTLVNRVVRPLIEAEKQLSK